MSLALRRWRTHAKLFALVLSVAIAAGSVLCGSLLLVRSSEQAGVSGALTSLSADRVAVTVRAIDPGSPVSGARAAADAATREAYGADVAWTSRGWATSDWSTTPAGVYSYLVELDDPSADAVLLEGAWPLEAPGVALPEIAARSLGLRVGDTVVLGDSDPLRIDALYEAAPGTGTFWENDPLQAQGDAQEFPEPNRSFFVPVHAVGPLITAPGGVDASGLTPGQLEAVERPTFASTGVEGLAELRAAAGDAGTTIAMAVPHPGGSLFVDTELPAALDDVAAGLENARAAALVVALLLAVVVAVCASAVTRLLAEARRDEFERLRERGAAPLQRAGAIAVDAVAVAAITAVVSPWGGVLLHALVVSAPPLDAAGLARWVLPDASVALCAIAVAIVVGVLLALPAAASGRRPLVAAGQSVLVVVAAVLVWRAATSGLDRGDLLLTLTPAVLLSAIAVIGGRLVEQAALPLAALAVRSRGAIAPLAGWFGARGAGRSSGVVLVALTIGASVIALGTSATWQQGVQDEAAVAVGPPARSSTSIDGSPVLRRQSLVAKQSSPGLPSEGGAVSAQILALDATGRQLLGTGGAPVVGSGGATIADELPAEDSVDTGPALPAGTSGLQVLAALEAPAGLEVALSAAVEDPRGEIAILPLGTLTSPTEATPLATADGAIDPADTLRLVAVTATLRNGESSTQVTVGISIDSIATVPSGGGAAVPLPMTDAAEWAGSCEDDTLRPPEIAVTGTGVRFTIVTQLVPLPVTYGAVGWNPNEAIGAVLPATLADDLDVLPGASVTAFLAGTPVALRMVGDTVAVPGAATSDDLAELAAGLPSTPRATATIVVDGRALAHRLVQGDAFGSLVDEYWTAAPEDSGAVTAQSLGREMLEAPLRAEIPASSAVVVWASSLLALAGFGARAAAVARSRRLEAAQLRAVGLSRRAMLAVLSADTAVTALTGVVVGLAAGWAVLALTGTRIAAGPSGRAVDLIVPWQAVSLLPLALLAALAVVSAALARGQRHLPLSDLLRQGDVG